MDRDDSIDSVVAAISQIGVVQTLLEVICRTTHMGFAAIAQVTDERWVACAVRDEILFGLVPGGELELETTICHEIRQSRQAVAIDHVAQDGAFCNHPTPRKYGFQSYISVPITLSGGEFFGTLCAIDPNPARVNTPEVLGMFTLFADLIARHLDAQDRLATSERALALERSTAQFRDQFIAVLGHDLRNPLGGILSAAELLRMLRGDDEDTMEAVGVIERSGRRMVELIDSVLDFARGTMGGGISVRKAPTSDLASTLAQVVRELQVAWPARELQEELAISRTVTCDPARIGQVLSNLVANALTHGAADRAVRVRARVVGEALELSVTNEGPTIPPEVLGQIFKPFVRGNARPGQQGLGLGLYIASEVARAHGGTLEVVSADGETCFTFRIPVG
jgi:signal transduction histidine kinase